jgi:putative mRNA 3-end processing factor
MPVELGRGGLVLQGTLLSFGARVKAPAWFISHAHSDHIARHEHVIATPATLALMDHHLGALETKTLPSVRRAHRAPRALARVLLGGARVRVGAAPRHPR